MRTDACLRLISDACNPNVVAGFPAPTQNGYTVAPDDGADGVQHSTSTAHGQHTVTAHGHSTRSQHGYTAAPDDGAAGAQHSTSFETGVTNRGGCTNSNGALRGRWRCSPTIT